LKDSGVDGRIILKQIFDNCNGKYGLFDMAQDRDWWWAVVNDVMNLHVL
jgi:hypothetical protein